MDDVFGIDAGPHDDAHLGQAGANLAELDGKGPLPVVEGRGVLEELGAFGVEGSEGFGAVRHGPVTGGIANGRHEAPEDEMFESEEAEAVPNTGPPLETVDPP